MALVTKTTMYTGLHVHSPGVTTLYRLTDVVDVWHQSGVFYVHATTISVAFI